MIFHVSEHIYENPTCFLRKAEAASTPLRSVLTALRPQDLTAVEQVGQPYFGLCAGHRATGQKQNSVGMVYTTY